LTLVDSQNKEDNYTIIKKNNYEFILDKSTEIFLDYILHIPYNHIYCEETFEKTHIGYDIFYIKHYYFDQVAHYFELDKLEDYMFETIITFLSSK
jgi:hypothetical protein